MPKNAIPMEATKAVKNEIEEDIGIAYSGFTRVLH